ncbi:hypothetical protein L208DRAFT_1207761, partial [Tricholoma matsutake]
TGLMQPCDVGFQQIFKHALKQSAHDDVVQEVPQQLKIPGKQLDNVTIDTTLGVFCNRTVKWMWNVFKKLNKPKIIKKAWAICKAGNLNSSYESLMSFEVGQALCDLPVSDPAFYAEL